MDTEYSKSLHRCCYFRNTFAIYKTFLLWYINQIISNTVCIALQIKENGKWLLEKLPFLALLFQTYFTGGCSLFLPHHGCSRSGVVLWLGGGTGWQRDITSSLFPIKGFILCNDSLLHTVLKHWHQQLEKIHKFMNVNQSLNIRLLLWTFIISTW